MPAVGPQLLPEMHARQGTVKNQLKPATDPVAEVPGPCLPSQAPGIGMLSWTQEAVTESACRGHLEALPSHLCALCALIGNKFCWQRLVVGCLSCDKPRPAWMPCRHQHSRLGRDAQVNERKGGRPASTALLAEGGGCSCLPWRGPGENSLPLLSEQSTLI